MVLLPGPGLATAFRVVVADSEFHVMGPFPDRVWLVELHWSFAAQVDGTLQLTFGLSKSADATLAALQGSIMLIQRSDQTGSFGRPSVLYHLVAGVPGTGRLFIGSRGGGGVRHLIAGIVVTGTLQDVAGIFSVRTLVDVDDVRVA